MSHLTETACRASLLMRALSPLGRARVVLRTCNGLAEIVCSTTDLDVHPPWAVLSTGEASVHIELAALRSAELRGGCAKHGAPPSICFVGRCGSPCLVVVLDRTAGAERTEQEILFRELRARWGTRISLDAEHAIQGEHRLQ
jgi:hypothetical protein